ncbi:MAG: nucleotidyltransferase domain-containing protein [Pseudomonadota bacterium]
MYTFNEKKFRIQLIRLGFLSISQFSKRTKIHRNTIYDYLTGKKKIFSDQFLAIAKSLNVSPFELIDESEAKITLEEFGISLIIDELLKKFPDTSIVLLGSRAKGTSTRYSDCDLGVLSNEKKINGITFLDMKSIVGDLADNLEIEIDLINLDAAPDWFIKELDESITFLKGKKMAFKRFLLKIAQLKEGK